MRRRGEPIMLRIYRSWEAGERLARHPRETKRGSNGRTLPPLGHEQRIEAKAHEVAAELARLEGRR